MAPRALVSPGHRAALLSRGVGPRTSRPHPGARQPASGVAGFAVKARSQPPVAQGEQAGRPDFVEPPDVWAVLIFTSGIGLAEGALRYLRQGEQRAQQPVTVTEAGDHSMALSDGQRWFGLNTGVAIYPGHAGLWSPFEHQLGQRKQTSTPTCPHPWGRPKEFRPPIVRMLRKKERRQYTPPPPHLWPLPSGEGGQVVVGVLFWPPSQHRIRAEDIDLVAKQGVDKIFVGKGMNGDGVAQLEPDAKERLAELEKHGVHPYVSNTPTATAKFNDAVKASADGTVAGLFHTGC
ncbi:unnamed protein product [Prorocentrum cordatum]|uniref:Uncharacterized protein n=1 Tax=Prorocentrum cordatum TaxID=2364126 RepID=A0ABN9S0Q5_9DINO|nr:unnamed protein product [Polarella glacialis]